MGADVQSLVREAEHAYDRIVHADFDRVRALVRSLRATSDTAARCWAAALELHVWWASPAHAAAPELKVIEEAASIGTRQVRAAVLRYASDYALVSLIGFDGAAAARIADALAPLGAGLGQDPVLELDAGERARVLLVRAIAGITAGSDAAVDLAEQAAREAAEGQLGGVRVQATALRALALAARGEVEAGLALARRASLMGRSEAIPHAEFLAHLCLARMRRLSRQPHLALRVLQALRRVVTPAWRAWLGWEWLWAGGGSTSVASDRLLAIRAPASAALEACGNMLEAARRGEREGFAVACQALRHASGGCAFALHEALELESAVDVEQPAASEAMRAFRCGDSLLTPPSLHGLRLRPLEETDSDSAAAYVFAAPGRAPARVLHWGSALLASDKSVRIRQSQRARGRVEVLLATTLLAGPPGIEEERCFAETYGFDFAPEVHRGVFDVLVHRARAALGDAGELSREAGRLRLVPSAALLLPDPRTSQRTTDRVLRLLSQQGRASAKDAADGLRISLRAAQAALKSLSETGACDAVRDGREVAYAVEDTVFSEPTQRLSAEQLSRL